MSTATSSDDVTVSYLSLGGSGPRLLLAHATGFCSTTWRPVAEALSGFECWALDFRGHGRSTPPADGRFDWHGTADDVLATIDAIDRNHPLRPGSAAGWLGAGHSMGGASLLLAEESRPGTFAGLWVYEPIVFPGNGPQMEPSAGDPGNHLAAGAARRRDRFESRQAALDNYSSKPPMNDFDPRALAGYLERGLVDLVDLDDSGESAAGGARLACAPANESQVYLMGGRHNAWAGLDSVGCPVTVLCGNTGVPGPAGFASAVAERLGFGRLEAHPDLGHFGPMQAPRRMATSIRSAFAATAPATAPTAGLSPSVSGDGPTIAS